MSTIMSSPERKVFPLSTPESPRSIRQSNASANTHPYAIKTTSTSVLTRSNSTGFASTQQHFYIPTTPSPSPSKHRQSKSDLITPARSSPRPLPIPPSFESPARPTNKGVADGQVFPQRVRAETLPSSPNPTLPSPVKVEDLPSNPRVWTTSQLASYLVTALRVRSGETLPLPLPVAKDVATFVRQERLTGRAFLRLTEQDLEQMEVNNLWRDALLNAARNLRANVLKGRIWGFEGDDGKEPAPVYPFRSRYNSSSSSSSIDETCEMRDSTPLKEGNNKGRVRRAVASLERSSSSGSGSSNRGSATSDGDVAHGAFSDDEASFASGSELSDVEKRNARTTNQKRVLPEPPMKKSVVEEPTVEELLEAAPLSSSWGAKAWEDMVIGETVKYIGSASPVDVDLESKELEFLSTGEARAQIQDILDKSPLNRPLPSPPKSGSASPVPRRLITGLPVEIVQKVNKGVQVDSGPETPISAGVSETGDITINAATRDELKEALTLLEVYKKRLEDAEAKLELVEKKRVAHVSQSIETDALLEEDTPGHTVEASCGNAPLSETYSGLNVETDTERGDGKEIIQLNSSDSLDDVEETSQKAFDATDWRSYVKRPDWDPLDHGVPTYVLMVGVGVCVVVLSTLVKRFVGKRT